MIRLPNDHTADPRQDDGYPYRASYVADNDLALGRIVAFLSGTPIWKDSAAFVTEDDAQGGVDHVDAHRSILLVASPWVRPGTASHQHTSMGSIIRTIDGLLGLGPLNLEDALAGDMNDVFDDHPRAARYGAPRRCAGVRPCQSTFRASQNGKESSRLARTIWMMPREIRKQMERSAGTLRRPQNSEVRPIILPWIFYVRLR